MSQPHSMLNNKGMVMMMEKNDFERKINSLVPCPDQETTADLFALGQELGEESEYGSTQDILNSLSFISRHFDKEITQGVYEIIQYGSPRRDGGRGGPYGQPRLLPAADGTGGKQR